MKGYLFSPFIYSAPVLSMLVLGQICHSTFQGSELGGELGLKVGVGLGIGVGVGLGIGVGLGLVWVRGCGKNKPLKYEWPICPVAYLPRNQHVSHTEKKLRYVIQKSFWGAFNMRYPIQKHMAS